MKPRFRQSATSLSMRSIGARVSGTALGGVNGSAREAREQRDHGRLDAQNARSEADARRAGGVERGELVVEQAPFRTDHERTGARPRAAGERRRARMRDQDLAAAR